jgi:hypothetical protein
MRWATINNGIVENVIEMAEADPTKVAQFCGAELAVLSDALNIGDTYIPAPQTPEPTLEEILLTALMEIQALKQKVTELEGE